MNHVWLPKGLLKRKTKWGQEPGPVFIEHLLYARPGEGQLVWALNLALQSPRGRSLSTPFYRQRVLSHLHKFS